ncbi:hypothetical protein QBC37DRAFT_394553 [Rhypophila decipiens]|uniref:Uncharacterized protein n=1 Tax=Rhypophila decipiens TaxID=261697 RepID=A0AAN7BFN8_9PEZI|nr:hypothetical protein QBC37DRAFT_394553 [Rhypophila decipiens]
MSSDPESKSFLQNRDDEIDDSLSDDDDDEGLIVHEHELLSGGDKKRTAPEAFERRSFTKGWIYLTLNNIFLGGNILLFAWMFWGVLTVRSYCPDVPSSILSPAIEYEDRVIDHRRKQPIPQRIKDDWLTWDRGFTGEIFRATEEDLKSSGVYFDDSLKLENGGYLSGLGVMHELHCLAWIQQMYAGKKTTPFERTVPEIGHLDHCIYVLFRSITCRPDLTIGGLYWEPSDEEMGHGHEHEERKMKRDYAHMSMSGGSHRDDRHKVQKCVKWEGVEAWLKIRLINQTSDDVFEGVMSPDGVVRHVPASELGDKKRAVSTVFV